MKNKRTAILYIAFICLFSLVTIRLGVLSQNGTPASSALAGQYSRRLEVISRRGFICDRNGEILSHTMTDYTLFVDPSKIDVGKADDAAELLAGTGQEPESFYIEKLAQGVPFVMAGTQELDEPWVKGYPHYELRQDDFLCHLLGYVNADGIGVTGIQTAYQSFLESTSGAVSARYEADARGRTMSDTSLILSDDRYCEKSGVMLTIDQKIQQTVERICNETLDRGAVVVTDPQSGEVLALCSRPSFSSETLADCLDSDRGELLNRALMGYTPGSIFKTTAAAAALEKDPAFLFRSYTCEGYIDLMNDRIRCHNTAGHGDLTMTGAFAQSCNPYFIDLALELGMDALLSEAEALGVGRFSSVDLIPAFSGTLPTEGLGLPSQIANTAVGQGDVLLSPLCVCTLVSTALTGVYHAPQLVLSLNDGENEYPIEKEEAERVLSESTVKTLRSMYRACVEEGTGTRADTPLVPVGGKTATAQSGQMKDGKEVVHLWFAGAFPIDEPRYTVCVLCDGNGENTTHPAEIFRRIAEALYSTDKTTEYPSSTSR